VAKATEKRNKIAAIECLLAIFVLITIYCETYCNSSNANCKMMKVATKLMKIVLFCTRFKLNEP
jgi:hypothetical protein